MELESALIDLLNLCNVNIERINDKRAPNGIAYLVEAKDAGTGDTVSRVYRFSIVEAVEFTRNSTVGYFQRREWEREIEQEEMLD